ncbi:MAG: DUF6261 family protein [Tannerellaceae bacterium]|jgi:hypothetical protein|nr:DUF6261 family protein [Tannerellaceae bacterium]
MFKIEAYAHLIRRTGIMHHLEFMSQMYKRLELEAPTLPELVNSWNAFVLAYLHEEETYKRHKLYDTQKVKRLDGVRCALVKGIRTLVKMKLKSLDEDERLAADVLDTEIIHTFGNFTRRDYEHKSALITKMTEEFKATGKHLDATNRLGLQPLVNELQTCNIDFILLYNVRSDEYLQAKEKGRATDARLTTDKAFKTLIRTMDALYTINEVSTNNEDVRNMLIKFSFSINAIILQTKNTVAHLGKRKNKKNEEAEATMTEEFY